MSELPILRHSDAAYVAGLSPKQLRNMLQRTSYEPQEWEKRMREVGRGEREPFDDDINNNKEWFGYSPIDVCILSLMRVLMRFGLVTDDAHWEAKKALAYFLGDYDLSSLYEVEYEFLLSHCVGGNENAKALFFVKYDDDELDSFWMKGRANHGVNEARGAAIVIDTCRIVKSTLRRLVDEFSEFRLDGYEQAFKP